jgi:hypothetical protein
MSSSEKLHFNLGLGKSTNNKVELCMDTTLLYIALEIRIKELAVYGDSHFIIGWLTSRSQELNIFHAEQIRSIRELSYRF